MIFYDAYKKQAKALVTELLVHSRRVMNDNGDLVWISHGAVLTTLTAALLGDEYDELNGFRIYDSTSVEVPTSGGLTHET